MQASGASEQNGDAASEVSKAVCTAAKGSRFKNLSEAERADAHQMVEFFCKEKFLLCRELFLNQTAANRAARSIPFCDRGATCMPARLHRRPVLYVF